MRVDREIDVGVRESLWVGDWAALITLAASTGSRSPHSIAIRYLPAHSQAFRINTTYLLINIGRGDISRA